MKFPSHLNCDGKIVSEMGPWITSLVLGHFDDCVSDIEAILKNIDKCVSQSIRNHHVILPQQTNIEPYDNLTGYILQYVMTSPDSNLTLLLLLRSYM